MLQAVSFLSKDRGAAGILSLIIMVLLSVIGAAYLLLSSSEVNSSANYRDGVAAQFLAEAGARRAIVELDKNPTWTGVAGVPLGSDATAGKYTVTVSSAGADRVVVAKGSVGNATRIMQLTLALPANLIPYPVFSGNFLILNSGFSVSGGDVATGQNQVTNNGFSGTVRTNVPMALPVIPVSFEPGLYTGGNTTALTTQPNTGNYDLAGSYYINGSFTTNSGVNISTSGESSATIFVNGSVTINGNVNGNITIIARQDITTNSGTTINGTIAFYAGANVTLNRPMTGNITVMSAQDLTLNSDAGQLSKAAVYAARDISFNSGVTVTGVVVAGNRITFNGGRVNYLPLGFTADPTGSLTIKSWKPN